MATVASLEAQLTINVQQFTQGINQATRAFETGAHRIEAASNRTTGAVEKLQHFLGQGMKAAVGIGIGAALLKGAANIRNVGKESIMGAARVEQMNDVLVVLGKTAGWTADEIEKQVQGIRDSGIEAGVAQRTLQDFIRYNLDVAKATDLARVAQDAAVLSNSNSSETLERLVYGISTQNSMILRTAGLQVQAGQAMSDFADSVGVAADELSGEQRVMAVFNAVMEEGTRITGAYEKSMENPIKQLGSLKRLQDDVANSLGKTMFPALQAIVNRGLTPFWKWLGEVTKEGSSLNDALTELGKGLAKVIDDFTEFLGSEGGDALKSIGESVLAIVDSFSAWGKILKDTETLAVALNTVAFALDLIAQVAKVLAPLLQGMIILKTFEKFTSILGLQNIAWKANAVAVRKAATDLTYATGQQVLFGGASKASIVVTNLQATAVKGLTFAVAKLSIAMKAAAPYLAAWAAYEVVTGLMDAWAGNARDAAAAQRDFNDALGEGVVDMEGFKEVLDNYLSDSPESSLNQKQKEGGFLFGEQTDDVKTALSKLAAELDWTEAAMERYINSFILGAVEVEEFEATLARAENALVKSPSIMETVWASISGTESKNMGSTDVQFIVDLLLGDRETAAQAVNDRIRDLVVESQAAASAAMSALGVTDNWTGGIPTQAHMQELLDSAILNTNLSVEDQRALMFELELAAQAAAEGTEDLVNEVLTLSEALEKANAPIMSLYQAMLSNQEAGEGWRDTLLQIQAGEISAANATGALAHQMSGLIDNAVATAEVQAEAMGVTLDSAEAQDLFRDEIERSINPLLAAADAIGVETTGLRALRDVLSSLDGAQANALVRIHLQFDGDIEKMEKYKATLESLAGRSSGEYLDQLRAQIEVVDSLIAITQAASSQGSAPWSPSGSGSGRSSSSSGSSGEPTFGGLTAREWEEIARLAEEAAEAIANYGREQARAFQEGVSLITGALRAQKAYNDAIERGEELQEERTKLINEEIPDIQKRIKETEKEIAQQEKLVEQLQREAAAITAVEQVAIESSQNKLRGAKRRYEAGLISAAELKAAEQELQEVRKNATGPTREQLSAEADLERMKENLIILEENLATAKERVLELDEAILVNAWDQVDAQAALGVALADVAANAELIRDAIAEIDFSNIPGAQEFIDSMDTTIATAVTTTPVHPDAVPTARELQLHRVGPTESLGEIAAQYGTTWQALMSLNNYIAGKQVIVAGEGIEHLRGKDILVPKMHQGGLVGGGGIPKEVLRMLQTGEGVVTRKAMKRIISGDSLNMSRLQPPSDSPRERITNTNAANITIHAGVGTDPTALGAAVVDALAAWVSTNGPLPTTVIR